MKAIPLLLLLSLSVPSFAASQKKIGLPPPPPKPAASERTVTIDVKDEEGRTALLLAAKNGRVDTVRLLLSRGADSTIRDIDGRTAFVLALDEEHNEVIESLLANAMPSEQLRAESVRGNVSRLQALFRQPHGRVLDRQHLRARPGCSRRFHRDRHPESGR